MDRGDECFYLKQFCPCKSVFPNVAVRSLAVSRIPSDVQIKCSICVVLFTQRRWDTKKWRPVSLRLRWTHVCERWIFLVHVSCRNSSSITEKKPNQSCFRCILLEAVKTVDCSFSQCCLLVAQKWYSVTFSWISEMNVDPVYNSLSF